MFILAPSFSPWLLGPITMCGITVLHGESLWTCAPHGCWGTEREKVGAEWARVPYLLCPRNGLNSSLRPTFQTHRHLPIVLQSGNQASNAWAFRGHWRSKLQQSLIVRIGSHSYGGRKSHNVQSSNWRNRKTGGVIPPESESQRNRRPPAPKTQGQGALVSESWRCMSHLKKRVKSPFIAFCSIQALNRYRLMPSLLVRAFYQVYWFKCQSLPETSPQTQSEIMFCQLSVHPIA